MVGYLDWLAGRATEEDVRSSADEQADWRATNLISVNQFAILHEQQARAMRSGLPARIAIEESVELAQEVLYQVFGRVLERIGNK